MSSRTDATGRIFDLGFRRYEGPREGRRRAMLAVYRDGLRTAMGLGRGGRAKIVPWLFIGASLLPALFLALAAGAVDRVAPDFDPADDLPSHGDLYSISSVVLLIFSALVGAELFCSDRRSGVISLYLVRPLRASEYAVSRWLALFTAMLAAAWLPQFVLLAGLVLGASDPGGYLADNWLDIPRFLLAGLVLAAYFTAFAALVASFTTRRAYAAASLVGLFVVSAAVIGGVTDNIGRGTGKWLALLGLWDVPLYVNDVIFGGPRTSGIDAAADLPGVVPVAWCLLIIGLCSFVLVRRYQRLSV